MGLLLYIFAVIAVAATALALTRKQAVHALLYLVVSLLAVALVFYAMGMVLVAALEVIVYAGAIMVLLVFVIMMLSSPNQTQEESKLLSPGIWVGPGVLAAALFGLLLYAFIAGGNWQSHAAMQGMIEPKQVGIVLWGPYLLGAELASILLLAGLVSVVHLGRGAIGGMEDSGA